MRETPPNKFFTVGPRGGSRSQAKSLFQNILDVSPYGSARPRQVHANKDFMRVGQKKCEVPSRAREPKAESRKPKAKSQKPKAKSRKPKAESQKPKAESQKPKAESR